MGRFKRSIAAIVAILASPKLAANSPFRVDGKVLPSTDEAHVFVEGPERIYRLKRSELLESDRKAFEKLFTSIRMDVPLSAIDAVWSTSHPSRRPAAVDQDEFWDLGGRFLISGEVISVFPPRSALIRAHGRIFEIDRTKLSSAEARDVHRVGRRVVVIVESDAILAVRSAAPKK